MALVAPLNVEDDQMSVSIKQNFKFAPAQEQIEMKRVMDAVLADMTVLRTAFTTLTAKMDTDFTAQNAAVTSSQLDVDYADGDPAALSLVS